MGSDDSDTLAGKVQSPVPVTGKAVPIGRGIVSSVLWPPEYLQDAAPRPGTECALSLRFLPGLEVKFSLHCAAEKMQVLGR